MVGAITFHYADKLSCGSLVAVAVGCGLVAVVLRDMTFHYVGVLSSCSLVAVVLGTMSFLLRR